MHDCFCDGFDVELLRAPAPFWDVGFATPPALRPQFAPQPPVRPGPA